MPIYIGTPKNENTTFCHSGESQNPDLLHPHSLDSSLRWNDRFAFGFYFRKNLVDRGLLQATIMCCAIVTIST
jgi:hypothetical protein